MYSESMQPALLSALPFFSSLQAKERHLLAGSSRLRQVEARQEISRQGDFARSVHFVLKGQTCRSKMLPDGSRQITGFLLPGDSCDLHGALVEKLDASVMTLTACTLAEFPRETITEWMAESLGIARLFLSIKIADEMILREWLVNVASRPAFQRISHLFCEMFTRSRAIGLGDASGFEFPVTQEELGQALGLSTVHVNRNLQRLRAEKLVDWQRHRVALLNAERLMQIATFNPSYLQPVH